MPEMAAVPYRYRLDEIRQRLIALEAEQRALMARVQEPMYRDMTGQSWFERLLIGLQMEVEALAIQQRVYGEVVDAARAMLPKAKRPKRFSKARPALVPAGRKRVKPLQDCRAYPEMTRQILQGA